MAYEPSGTDGHEQSAEYEQGQHGGDSGYWQQPADYSAAYGSEYAYGQQGQQYDPAAYGQYQGGTYGYPATGYESYQTPGYDPNGYAATGYESTGYQQTSYDTSAYQTTGYPTDTGQDATRQWSPQQYAEYGGGYGQTEYPAPGYDPNSYGAASYAAPAAGAAAESAAEATPAQGVPATEPPGDPDAEADPDAAAVPQAEGPLLQRLIAAATGRAPGTDRRTFLLRAGAGAAALVVLVVAGVLVSGGGPGKAAAGSPTGAVAQLNVATAHTKAWTAASAATGAGTDGLVGSWLTAKAVVRADGTGVTAYATSDGHKLWTLAAPGAGAVPCAMSPGVNTAGVGAVLYQPKSGTGQPCTSLVAVDTATGQSEWTATVAKNTGSYGATVGITDTRAVVVGDSQAVGYDAATGSQKWTYSGPGKYCTLNGDAGATTVVVQSTCADTTPKQQAIQLDATGGRLSWWRGLPDGASSYTVLSAEPPVIAVNQSQPGSGSIVSFSSTGTSQPTIPLTQTAGTLSAANGVFSAAPGVFFQGGTMVTTFAPDGNVPGAGTTVTAFDLATGKQLWQTPLQEKGQAQVVGIDSTAAIVATQERSGQPARLDRIGLADGKEAQGGAFPSGTGSLLTAGRVLYNSSLIVALPSFASTYNASAVAYQAAG